MIFNCNVCQGDKPPIHGDGPYPSTVMAIGENPGWDEWFKTRRNLTGKPGRELNERILPKMGIQRSDLFTVNSYRCFKPRGVSPSAAEARVCSDHWLHADLTRVRPYVILAFGPVSWSLFDNNLPISVVSGIPFVRSFGSWTGYVIPIMHPAAGMRKTDMMIQILEDAKRIHEDRVLEQCITNTYVAPTDPYIDVDYEVIETVEQQEKYWQAHADIHAGLDTESDTSLYQRLATAPAWCLTYSLAPGTGRMIMANNTAVLQDLAARFKRYRMLIAMHNALHDVNVCTKMRVEFERGRIIDTMLRANSIQTLPKGLKALAYRILHMSMQDFDDVTVGPSTFQSIYYLQEVVRQIENRYQVDHVLKAGPRKGVVERRWGKDKPVVLGRGISQIRKAIEDFSQSPVRVLDPAYPMAGAGEDEVDEDQTSDTTDVWKRWDNWRPELRAEIVATMAGMPFPRKSITWAPFQAAKIYAVRDADATQRLYPELRRRMFGVGHAVPQGA